MHIRQSECIPLTVPEQESLLLVLPHPLKPLRHTAGTCISTVVSASGIAAWPELVAALLQCLHSDTTHVLDGGLNSLYKVCAGGLFLPQSPPS